MDVFCSSAAAGSGASQIVYLYQNDTSNITVCLARLRHLRFGLQMTRAVWQYGGYAYQEGTSGAQGRVQLSVIYNDSTTDVAFFTPIVSSAWTQVYM